MTFSNSQYIASPDMWQLFTDRDTSTFLYGGYALFFVDTARTTGKPVYQITGIGIPPAPPYSFIEYGSLQIDGSWRVDLNSQGAFDQTVYLLPFDVDNNIEQYYIEFYSADNVFQFSLEGWPQSATAQSSETQVFVNFVPNPQFLTHNNIPFFVGGQPGQIPSGTDLVNFAPGNWYFERPSGTTATDFILFSRFGSPLTVPSANPRYALNFVCTVPDGSDNIKDLAVRFDNVNTFASTTDYLTFSFWAVCNSGSSVNLSLVQKYNFGTGGSTEVSNILTTFTVTNSWSQYSFSFIPGTLVGGGYSIGTQNDDYVEYAIRAPTTSASNFLFTDVIITPGQISSPSIPDITSNETVAASLAGSTTLPDYNEQNLYLPIVLGPNGFTYDTSIVGKIFPSFNGTPGIGELLCNGQTLQTNLTSTDGIPFSRLWNVLFNPVTQYPMFGTGSTFVSAYVDSALATPQINLSTNGQGNVTNTADGAAPTGFTFATIHAGNNYNTTTWFKNNSSFILRTNFATKPGTDAATPSYFAAHTAPVVFTQVNYNALATDQNYIYITFIQEWNIAFTGIPSAGNYFTFAANNGTTNVPYYVWYKVNGSGSDPAPGAPFLTGIEIDILSTYSTQDVAILTAQVIAGNELSTIVTLAGNAVPASSYWTFSSTTQNYYVWYTVNGSGTDPMVPGKIGIKVPILTTDTTLQVATKTQLAINSFSYAIPDLRGVFLRGFNDSAGLDPDAIYRAGFNPLSAGDQIGSIQFDSMIQTVAIGVDFEVEDEGIQQNLDTELPETLQGNGDTRPVNVSVNWVIKY